MKFLLPLLAVLVSFQVEAKQIKRIPASQISTLGTTDMYAGPLPVGRLSPFSYQFELTALTVVDPWSATVRKVKATVGFWPQDPNDPGQVSAAQEALSYLYATKKGKYDNGGGSMPISKNMGIMYAPGCVDPTGATTSDPCDSVAGPTPGSITRVPATTGGCMGSDLEVADATTPTTKWCYYVLPNAMITYAP